jgi:6-phosphogluconate dehydrogenase
MYDIGVIGLGVMGKNIALNIEDKGYSVSVYNRTYEKTKNFIKNEAKGKNIFPFSSIESLLNSLRSPKKILLMIKAGQPVDDMIGKLTPYLDEGDIIIDGGNTYYLDTSRRIKKLKEKKILYLGMGISGGEEGALKGPSIMPGGSRQVYDMVKEMLGKIAAQTDDGPCCTYIGNGSAGHFVKMIHNGIEYGIMQAMSETYDIMNKVLNLSAYEIGDIFERWNEGQLNSYLMEISYKIMRHKDEETGKPTVDLILDKAGQKGTGKWTVQASIDMGIPAISLNAALEGRVLSYFKDDREELSRKVIKKYPDKSYDKAKVIKALENSLLFTNLILFSQGLWLMSEGSKEYDFDIDISEVLRIWKGGCIIRSKMLDFMRNVVFRDNTNVNLLNDKQVLDILMGELDSVKYITDIAKDNFLPAVVHNTALDYFLSMTEEKMPANLIQAQRDLFGAHTYNRIDKDGTFHTNWE